MPFGVLRREDRFDVGVRHYAPWSGVTADEWQHDTRPLLVDSSRSDLVPDRPCEQLLETLSPLGRARPGGSQKVRREVHGRAHQPILPHLASVRRCREDDPDNWEELPPLPADAPPTPKRLGAVLSVRLDPDRAEALSREAKRRSRLSGTTIGYTTLARQLIAEGLQPPRTRVTVELELGQDGRVKALPVAPYDREVA